MKKKYSQDVQKLVEGMMDASKLTPFQKKQLKQTMKDGGQLPYAVHPSTSQPNVVYNHDLSLSNLTFNPLDDKKNYNNNDFLKGKKSYMTTKKKLDTMIKEGAFDEPAAPATSGPHIDRDKEKEKLTTIFQVLTKKFQIFFPFFLNFFENFRNYFENNQSLGISNLPILTN